MESNLQIFNNSEFGELEVMMIDGKPYFPATECVRVLGHCPSPRKRLDMGVVDA